MSATNFLVFRDARDEVELSTLVKGIKQPLGDSNRFRTLDALIAAGQMESALADCASPDVGIAEHLTDQLAAACIDSTPLDSRSVFQILSQLTVSRQQRLKVSEPEGFSYYALHPLDFHDVFRAFTYLPCAAVIGIRSIGTTLSAVAAATLRRQGAPAERITVRPVGHPYSREVHFTGEHKMWIERQKRIGAPFFVVDEGPGLSGSSFLSVAEGLIDAGVLARSIHLIGTHPFDAAQLCATDAAERWSRFTFHCVPSRISARFSGQRSLSGGNWRRILLAPQTDWPAIWSTMESTKYLSENRDLIFKFEGFGRFGDHVRARAQSLYEGGFTPRHANVGEGISQYQFVEGVPLQSADLSKDMLNQIAEYCSFRAGEFRTDSVNPMPLKEMTEFNFSQETGRTLDSSMLNLETDVPVISDNRMRPHEWIRSKTGHVLKVDASQHGSDHFFPGPTDITWDLAGAIIEWDLDSTSSSYLLDRFQQRSGYDVSRKLKSYLVAYSAFRMAYCKMASNSIADAGERTRLQTGHSYYRARMLSASTETKSQRIYRAS